MYFVAENSYTVCISLCHTLCVFITGIAETFNTLDLIKCVGSVVVECYITKKSSK